MEEQARTKLTVPGVVLVVIIVAIGVVVMGFFAQRSRRLALRTRCGGRLMGLGTALQLYITTSGGHRFYPYIGTATAPGRQWQNHGANFLIANYWAGTAPDSSIFICPATDDDNEYGKAFGEPNWGDGVALKPHHCSYAALAAPKPGECYDVSNVEPDDIIACDDTDGGRNNHRSGKCVLRADLSTSFFEEETMRTLDQPPYNGRVKD